MPDLIREAGDLAVSCFREFIDTALSNPNTRTAYGRAIAQFLTWCSETGPRRLDEIEPGVIARYLQEVQGSEATLKQHLAAIRALFNVLALVHSGLDTVTLKLSFDRGATFGQVETFGGGVQA